MDFRAMLMRRKKPAKKVVVVSKTKEALSVHKHVCNCRPGGSSVGSRVIYVLYIHTARY